MENWGLSVFVEQKILLDPEVSSFSYQMDLTMVVVHEICHQWLGDLVTPVWWDDVWIKEGFAHYFEYVGSDFLFPKWNMKQRFLTDVLHEVMLLDGMATSHPISEELFQVADIHRVFDWISYKKGAALIRMLANVMGQTAFQRGINDYLVTHEYGNTARDDLWNSFSQAMQREGKDISIKEVMDGWTLQMGYPVVTISKHESLENTVTISQEHFLYDTDAKIHHHQLFNKRTLLCCSGFQAMQREGKDISIKEVMDGWTLQMGYPVVTISKHESLENTVTISQEHFLYDTDAKIHHHQLYNKRYRPVQIQISDYTLVM
ncbi:hypothetical protein PGIGA_G00089200 [Pangasianodon gigas]|uniref:Uncharacterized protein n=1 Tax=Pangasianodon gigas TaxID=30993 RepID=A0ACC5XCZ6_PANGG|nr:hypothetical protein [Pangasianodon gigas]